MRRINEATLKTYVSVNLKSQLTKCVKMPITMSRNWKASERPSSLGEKSIEWKSRRKNSIISKPLTPKERINSSKLLLVDFKMTLKTGQLAIQMVRHP